MKKQITTVLSFFAVFSFCITVYAQTELTEKVATSSTQTTEVSSESATVVEPEIQDLKEKIATKVAELRKKNQKAVAGHIDSIKGAVIMATSADASEYEVKLDESLTKTYQIGTGYKEIKSSDLKKGDYIIVTGPMLDKTIDANVIYRDEQYVVMSGKVTEVDKTDFFLKVTTTSKDNVTIDIETKTLQQLLNIKTLQPEKTVFSKIKEGDTVHFAAKKDIKVTEENRYSALRVLIIPQEFFQK